MSRSLEDKVEMIFVISAAHQNFIEAEKRFNDRYPDRPTNSNYLRKLMQQFQMTGTVKNAVPERIGRPPVSPTTEMNILWDMIENPQLTSKDVSTKYNVAQSLVLRLLKKNKFHATMIRKKLNLDPSHNDEIDESISGSSSE